MLHLVQIALLLAPAAGPAPHPAAVRVTNSYPVPNGRAVEGGSGVVVRSSGGKSYIATNQHTVESGGVIHCYFPYAGEYRQVKAAYYVHKAADLVLLVVDAEWPAAELAPELPARDTPLFLTGFPKGVEEPVVKAGKAVGPGGPINRLSDGRKAVTFDTTIRSVDGDSGGGQFDAKGRLVCLSMTGGGSAVPVTAVRELLGALK